MSRKLADADRVLELLEEHGQVDSLWLRENRITANPSQRIEDLRARGCLITAIPDTYTDAVGKTRRRTIYRLDGGEDAARAELYRQENLGTTGRLEVAASSGAPSPDEENADLYRDTPASVSPSLAGIPRCNPESLNRWTSAIRWKVAENLVVNGEVRAASLEADLRVPDEYLFLVRQAIETAVRCDFMTGDGAGHFKVTGRGREFLSKLVSTDEVNPADAHRRTDDEHAERILDAENAEAERDTIEADQDEPVADRLPIDLPEPVAKRPAHHYESEAA